MSQYGQTSGIKECLTTPVANWVGENATTVVAVPTHCASINTIGVFRPEYCLVTLVITGANAGSSGNVTARFKVRGDEAQPWSNNTLTTYDITGALSGTTEMRYNATPFDCRGIIELKLYSIQSTDATYHCTANVEVTFKD
jgi:hypothetical protein